MPVPKKIRDLVKRFHDNLDAHLSSDYIEDQVRRDFIDPFFEALGWDVSNKKGQPQQHRDVLSTKPQRLGEKSKAPDMTFRIGGMRKFFVECKKPSLDLKEDPELALQLRGYAWSAKLPVSILTDFHEFAIYDCRIRPYEKDKATLARIIYFTYEDYEARWNEIESLFSHDAVQGGSLEKFAKKLKKKKGKLEVDDAFLEEIEKWRDLLARNIAGRNPRLGQPEINYAVQQTIDRIIFMRICEDREIEPEYSLKAVCNGANIYSRLFQMFDYADKRYNSGLFYFTKERGRGEEPDALSALLKIDDHVLKEIINSLYWPNPYKFDVMPADILGQIYERFLGKVIRLTEGHHAKVEEKPEVRKAGGVYYTPTYIVDYIVKNTVGKLLEGKTPKQVENLRILDPACGSGSFLIGAYQYLLDWHLHYYVEHGPAKNKKQVYQAEKGEWRLTTSERKRILLNNIFGVDIDSQAVEVTKLSLLLKVLEGENAQTLHHQYKLFHERALPDLVSNIKCGNSLIGPEELDRQQIGLFSYEGHNRINAFDWKTEFPDVLKSGGFDAVIGNPPYIRIQAMKEWAPEEVELYKERYKAAAAGNYDIYVVFVEKGLQLLNNQGRLGFILPHKFFNAKYGNGLRGIIAEGRHLAHVVHFGDQQVFAGATTYTCLMFLDKTGASACRFVKVSDLDAWRAEGKVNEALISAKMITDAEWNFLVGAGTEIFRRIRNIPTKLGDIAHIFQGLVTGADNVFVVPLNFDIELGLTRPFLLTGDLAAYVTPNPSARIIFPYKITSNKAELISVDMLKKKFPKGWAYLCEHREDLMSREHGKWRHERWYAFGRSQNLIQMDDVKLIIQVTAQRPTVLLDESSLYMTGGGSGPFYGIRPKDQTFPSKYLLGILNSTFFGWLIKAQSTNLRGGYIKFSKQYIETAPIVPPEKAGPEKIKILSAQVDEIIGQRKQFSNVKTPHEKTALQRQIAATDRQIDQLVYELYGLTEGEVKIVEESMR
jgi:type I restriction-modification system DNA methylase subunit